MKKKGFTLIELLAVIVILAIIAIIASPILIGIIEDTRKEAFERSVEQIVSATDMNIMNQNFDMSYSYKIENGIMYKQKFKEFDGYEIVYDQCIVFFNSIVQDDFDTEIIPKICNDEPLEMYNGLSVTEFVLQEPSLALEGLAQGFLKKKYKYTYEDMNLAKNMNGINGRITYYESGVINEYALHNNKWCVTKMAGSDEVKISEYNGSCEIPTVESCFTYEEIENGINITDYSMDCPKEVVMPSKINGKDVISIGELAFAGKRLTKVDLSNLDKLVSIGDSAFMGESEYHGYVEYEWTGGIEELKLPKNVETIGNTAFAFNQIREVDFSNMVNLKSIGAAAFTFNLLSGTVDLSASNNLTFIGEGAFAFYNLQGIPGGITTLKLPSSIEIIGNAAFAHNIITNNEIFNNLTNLKEIGYSAFSDTFISGELDLSNTKLTTIENSLFCNTNVPGLITGVKLPTSITTISESAFEGHQITGELDLSYLHNLKYVAGFKDNQIEIIKLPISIEEIGSSAFYENKITGELDLSYLSNLKEIGENAFQGTHISFNGAQYQDPTNQITSIKLPTSIEKIGYGAFRYNKITGELDLSYLTNLTSVAGFEWNDITSVKFPVSVVTIDEFENNKLSGELDLSDLTNLTTIDYSAFRGNTYVARNVLTRVKLPSSIKEIDSEAFRYNQLEEVTFYGRSNLTGVTLGSNVWGWAEGFSESNIKFET